MKPLKLAVVQFTPEFGKKEKNLFRMQELVEDVGADIIVFPELCTTGYFFQSRAEAARSAETASGPASQFFRDMARGKNAVVVAGFAERHRKNLYNACLVAVPEEKKPHVYRKTHLFYKEKDCFDPGDTGFFVVVDKKRDVRIGPMVCYDWRFPESARVLTLLGADLIVCPANLVTEAWRRVMPARAIENNVYLAVANRAGMEKRNGEELRFKGNSAIYDFSGREIKKAGKEKDEVLLAEIYPSQTRDKSFNAINDVLADRQPRHYKLLTRIVK
ncbi:MAG: nitrilase-related carbon-nitrogen hydrolase [Deltaproteobacteria bacterium]|jgi:predicted amidohydrolase